MSNRYSRSQRRRLQRTSLLARKWKQFETLEQRQLLATAVNDTGMATQNAGPVMFDVTANDLDDSPETVLYADDFSGTGALNGAIPDTRGGGESWLSAGQWNADGTKTAGGTASSWLPFTPTAGRVFTLSLDVNPDTSASSDWFAAGYSAGNNVNDWHPSNNTTGWLLNREDDTSAGVIQTFLGPSTGGGAGHDLNPDVSGPVGIDIVLDTRAAAWSVEWFAEGNSIRGPVAFGTNPTINYVGFGAWSTATGSVDNFSLTVANPAPETNLQVTSASAASGASVTVPSAPGEPISYDPSNIASTSDTITYAITDTSGVTQPHTTVRGSAGTFNVSDSDLLNGLTPTVTGSALSGREGSSTDPAVLTNGAFGPAATIDSETVSILSNTALTFDLDLGANPQGYDLSGINTYSGWADDGRDNQDYTVLYATVDHPDAFIPLSTVSYAPNPAPSGEVSLSAAGGIFASRVGQIQFVFGAQENDEVGYRELDAFGTPSVTAEVDVSITNANTPPTGVDDTANALEDGGPVAIDVTANDTDPEGNDIVVDSFDPTSNSGATITANGNRLVYDPSSTAAFDSLAVGETATDTFTYTLADATQLLTDAGGSLAAGATQVLLADLENADLGNDRRIQVEFDVSRPEDSTGDSWFTLELLASGTGVSGADASSLVRTRTDLGMHQLFTNGALVQDSATASIATPIDRHVIATFDLTADGIANGAQASVTFEIDDDSNGTIDHTLSAPFTLTGASLDLAVQTTGKTHNYSNFNVTSRRGGLISNLFNTGVDDNGQPLPGDVPDSHYDLVSQPIGGLTDATIPDDGFPIGAWLDNDPNSTWIGPDNADAANDGNGPPGSYTYRTTFTVPSDADLSTLQLSGSWATDNSGSDILINGVSTGSTASGFVAYSAFNIESGFQLGVNTLEFVMVNNPEANPAVTTGPTGLRVDDMTASYQAVSTDTATITVTVTGTNDGPPVAVDDNLTTSVTEDAPVDVTAEILSNDTDPDTNDALTVNSIDDSSTTGEVTLAGGTVTYNPNGLYEQLGVGDMATDTFTYTVADRDPLQTGVAIADLFNTGVDGSGAALAGDLDDPHYEIIAQPENGTLVDATIPADGFPIPPWLANDTNSAWTGPDNADTDNDGNAPPGTYIYRTTFTIPTDANLDSVTIGGNWATDNMGSDILINGVSTGNTTAGFNAYESFSLSTGFVYGVNTLDFVVENGAPTGPTALRVDDMSGTYDIGQVSNSATVTVTINGVNDAPTVETDNAAVTTAEGTDPTNSGTFDDIDASDSVTISASVGDIVQDSGNSGTWSWSLDSSTLDGPSTPTITITATDESGATDTVTFDLTVTNEAPTLTITGPDPAEVALDAPAAFSFTATDPSTADQVAGFDFEIDWGDGTPTEMVNSTSPLNLSHNFQTFGELTVTATATDKDGGESDPATFVINVVPVAIVGDDLVATGTQMSDRIIFYPSNQGIRVRYNNETYPLDGTGYSFSGQMIANGRGGSDQIIVSGVITNEANFHGGEDNDYLAGGAQNDTLSGGEGNDILLGSEGDNVIIGDAGNDRMEGRSGDDLLFGGAGNDRLNGNAGNDILDGGEDNDFLFGGLDDDLLVGRVGSDTLNGHLGHDLIFGGVSSDQLFGSSGNDLLIGGEGSDRVRGDSGDDTLVGGTSPLEAQLEIDLDSLLASNGMGGLSAGVQAAIDAWFASQDSSARAMFEPFADDGVAEVLTGDSGVDSFVVGAGDSFRDFRSDDIVL